MKRKQILTNIQKERKKELARKRYSDNPEKYKAHYKFRNAIKLGRIQRPTYCQICGIECITNGHHNDYTKPLEVIFICDSCHGKQHRKVVQYDRQR